MLRIVAKPDELSKSKTAKYMRINTIFTIIFGCSIIGFNIFRTIYVQNHSNEKQEQNYPILLLVK